MYRGIIRMNLKTVLKKAFVFIFIHILIWPRSWFFFLSFAPEIRCRKIERLKFEIITWLNS